MLISLFKVQVCTVVPKCDYQHDRQRQRSLQVG